MAHLYEGTPDDRQAGDIKPSRFRSQYRALSDEEKALHDQIKAKATELEALFERARELRHPIIPLMEAADPADTQMPREAGFTDLEPGAFVVGVSDFLGPDYFGEGMKALELSVMWTVKGLTA